MSEHAPAADVSPVSSVGLLPDARPTNLEAPIASEKDARGLAYVFNLIALYLTFFIFFVAVAWFGIFSDT